MSENVRLQNLRDFTVQIRRGADDAIVGTGVAVSTGGQVVTCAHVVEAALGVHPRQANGGEVGVYFPQARGGEAKARRARVAACFRQYDDDVVLLQLTGGLSPLAPEQMPALGRAEASCYHPFRSYGYRRLEHYIAGHAHGTILDCVPPPEGRKVQTEPVQLESQQINQGMSGAAVLDVERNLVVGVVSEIWFPDRSTRDRDTAWAVNARVLSLAPLNLPLRDVPLPMGAAPQPKTDVAAARRLEVMQNQEGDRYGLLRSADLREFLEYFAAPGHASFCLVTSRAPVLDLMDYTSYRHRDVTRLSPADGRALLRAVSVTGPDEVLDRVVADWDGHALTLSLLGAYLADRHGGDVAYLDDIPPPTVNEERYERVHRVLRRYDDHLTDAERAFLTLFSAFRTPVEETAFSRVFRAKPGVLDRLRRRAINAPIAALDDASFEAMVRRLITYRLLRYDPRAGHYTAHPLIRAHYSGRLKELDSVQVQAAHARIKDYYLDLAGDTPRFPTLDDLAPLVEAVHHACRAGAYNDAHRIWQERIDQGNRKVILHQLGAYETALALMLEFFPGGDVSQDPQVSDPGAKRFILNRFGFCLMSLGRLGEAAPFYERKNAIALDMEDWHNASIGYRNLASLHIYLGALATAADAARQALALARRAENKRDERLSLAFQAWAAHLRGDLEAAGAAFRQAEALEREIDLDVRYLYSLRGIRHADHLWRAGDPAMGTGGAAAYAWRVTEANLEICKRNRFVKSISQCHRVLGDLDADAQDHDSAREHYDEALKIARGITYRPALIEALLARGRWAARHRGDPSAAFSDLNEALGDAIDGGYRIYEADLRVALAWAHRAAGDPARARAEAERARRISAEVGYHWGQLDAAEVLGKT